MDLASGNWIEFHAPRGVDGRDGRDGASVVGPTGPKGEAGHDGKDGAPGKDGASVVGPTGPKGDRGDAGRDGKDGQSIVGKQGPAGRDGKDGKSIEGKQGPKGDRGVAGRDGKDGKSIVGAQGPKGDRGNDGTGLKLKPFKISSKYDRGDYVFSKSSKDNHDSMYIAEKSFTAVKLPHMDLASGNWIEFHAPRGVDGRDGRDGASVVGPTGPKGEAGHDGKDGAPGKDGASVVGPTGPKGDRGDAGRDGKDGQSIVGKQGPAGKQGPKGEQGSTGPYGKVRKPIHSTILKALEKRSTIIVNETAKKATVAELMKTKGNVAGSGGTSTCPRVTGVNSDQLDKYKTKFCPVSRHLDLTVQNVENIALVYLEKDIDPLNNTESIRILKDRKTKFIVKDGCASPLFSANDISIQKIEIDGRSKKEWVALVKLDSTSKDGYLQNELERCKDLDYVPQTRVSVQVNTLTGVWQDCPVNHVTVVRGA
eukprot:g16172.t1